MRIRSLIVVAALVAWTGGDADAAVKHRRHHRAGETPAAQDRNASGARANDCSNGDCRGINSSNGIGGSGGF